MRTMGLALAATLLATGCSTAPVTATPVELKAGMTTRITEPRVVTAIAAMGSETVALEEDRPGLLGQARVTDANARVIALQRIPGGRVVEAELEQEHGKLVYSYEIRVADGRSSIDIDARTGAVLSEKHEEGIDEQVPAQR